MKYNDMFPSQYYGKDDLLEGPLRMRINAVEMEPVSTGDDKKEDKAVMSFLDGSKKLVLNMTNGLVLKDAYGLQTEAWHGKPIELYHDPNIMFGGKRVGGTRVRIPNGNTAAGTDETSFGEPPDQGQYWTFDQAIAAAATAGLDREAFIDKLKAKGRKGWNNKSATDTAMAKQIIAEAVAPTGGDVPFDANADDGIPF